MRRSLDNFIKVVSIFALSALLALFPPAIAKGHSVHYAKTSHSAASHAGDSHASHSKPHAARSISAHTPKATKAPKASHGGNKAQSVLRDAHGKIARSPKAKSDFKKKHPCPSTVKTSGACPGYVIDHVKPLKRGGADAPSNMQWQTTAAAKQKDKTE